LSALPVPLLNFKFTVTQEEFEEHIRMALESGLSGFQMMAGPSSKMFESAMFTSRC
jgi:hypothetical protein